MFCNKAYRPLSLPIHPYRCVAVDPREETNGLMGTAYLEGATTAQRMPLADLAPQTEGFLEHSQKGLGESGRTLYLDTRFQHGLWLQSCQTQMAVSIEVTANEVTEKRWRHLLIRRKSQDERFARNASKRHHVCRHFGVGYAKSGYVLGAFRMTRTTSNGRLRSDDVTNLFQKRSVNISKGDLNGLLTAWPNRDAAIGVDKAKHVGLLFAVYDLEKVFGISVLSVRPNGYASFTQPFIDRRLIGPVPLADRAKAFSAVPIFCFYPVQLFFAYLGYRHDNDSYAIFWSILSAICIGYASRYLSA